MYKVNAETHENIRLLSVTSNDTYKQFLKKNTYAFIFTQIIVIIII